MAYRRNYRLRKRRYTRNFRRRRSRRGGRIQRLRKLVRRVFRGDVKKGRRTLRRKGPMAAIRRLSKLHAHKVGTSKAKRLGLARRRRRRRRRYGRR